MELPDDVIAFIKDFSRPLTRPDWRTLKRLDEKVLLWNIFAIYNSKRIPVIEQFVTYYVHDSDPNYFCTFRAGFIVQLFKN